MNVQATERTIEIQIEGKGHIRSSDVEHARSSLEKVIRPISDPVLSVKVMLAERPNYDTAHRAQAEASINIKGDWVRGHTTAPTMAEAIDELEDKLRGQLRHRADRYRRNPAGREASAGEWQHGNTRSAPLPYFDRPIDERELVRHKTFATPTASVEEACWDMMQLDYDFFLFRDEATGNDAAITMEESGSTVRAIEDAPALKVEEAVDWLNNAGDRFVFFNDVDTTRGAIVYRRYDGHYGLLTPR